MICAAGAPWAPGLSLPNSRSLALHNAHLGTPSVEHFQALEHRAEGTTQGLGRDGPFLLLGALDIVHHRRELRGELVVLSSDALAMVLQLVAL